MRLGQLSRKLETPISDIRNTIKKKYDVTIGEHPNIKVDDEYVEYFLELFNKADEVIVYKAEEPIEKEVEVAQEVSTELEVEKEDVKDDVEVENKEEEVFKSKIETIRAKAAKLEGLKIIDKIDLPPPPPPEMIEIDGVMYDKAELKKQRIAERKEHDANRKREAAKRALVRKPAKFRAIVKNELSLSDKRRIEEQRDNSTKKKEEVEKRRKQKKHYDSKHKVATPIKKKVKKVSIIEVEEIIEDTRPTPKTMLGKFWRWLNTY